MRKRWNTLEGMVAADGLTAALLFGAVAASGFGAGPALAFLTAALAVAIGRIAVTVRDGRRLLGRIREAERIDPLTGLGNRRELIRHLETELDTPGDGPLMLAIFTLDGLQHYNETYGGLAGDALVRRVAGRLNETVRGQGLAFRPSGGRFAVVERVGRPGFEPLVSAATAALSEEGEGFCIDALAGVVQLPDEAVTADQALLLADQRLMARREARRATPPPSLRQLVDEAVRRRREPLAAGAPTLAELARSTAARLGLTVHQAARAALAAELRAIGKLAVPREILAKPGRLTKAEWEFIEHHALVGERIVEIAVQAPDVAEIVRASHERHDGTGYPDGLAGEAIPIEARIAAVCGAYEAMLAPRPHRPAHSSAEALEELERVAGTQFDPLLIGAFAATVAEATSRRTTREGALPFPLPTGP